jgi:hypothetical protein
MGEGELGVVTTDADEKKLARPTSRVPRKGRHNYGLDAPVEVHVHVEEHDGMQDQDGHQIHLKTFRMAQRGDKKQYDLESANPMHQFSGTVEMTEGDRDMDSKSTDFPTFAPMPMAASDHDAESQVPPALIE